MFTFSNSDGHTGRKIPWSREELILALDLYVNGYKKLADRATPFGGKDSEVIELSNTLRQLPIHPLDDRLDNFRNTKSVEAMIYNFQGLNPNDPRAGLPNASQGCRSIWAEFALNPVQLRAEADAIRKHYSPQQVPREQVDSALGTLDDKSTILAENPGFQPNPEIRRVIELAAMRTAIAHFKSEGWHVDDVSGSKPFDLVCARKQTPDLHVEVKGTSTAGESIILTRNEVSHAHEQFPNMALFVLSQIRLVPTIKGLGVQGGRVTIKQPWAINESGLNPLAFSYVV